MINKKLVATVSLMALMAAPFMASAIDSGAAPVGNTTLSVDGIFTAALNFLWPVFIGFSVIMFLIAAFYFISAQGEPDGVKKARDFVIWGIVGVVVGVLAFSIPFVVRNILFANGIQ